MQLTQEQRVFVVSIFLQTNSVADVVQRFQERFPERQAPTGKTVRNVVRKFQTHGTVKNLNSGNSGRRKTVCSAENIELVRAALEENPTLTTRRNGLNISQKSVNRIIRKEINWFPYKIRRRHEIKDGDHERRLAYSRWLLRQFNDPLFRSKIVIGDEAAFSMNGHVCSKNMVMYSPKGDRPEFHYDVPNSREKVTVWSALCGNGELLGPYFFDGNIDGETYFHMLNVQVVPDLNNIFNFNIVGDHFYDNNVWWFQDGAPWHQRVMVRNRLRELFGNQIVSLNHDLEWPPRSPDLTPCDFFLWGYIKSKVFETPPQNVLELRERIFTEFDLLRNDRELIVKVVRSMESRAQKCIERNGGHIEGQY